MTYLENLGSGAKRIIDACRAQNVEEPTWSDHGGFITVTFSKSYWQTLNFAFFPLALSVTIGFENRV